MKATANFRNSPTALEIKIEGAIQTALAEIPNADIFPITDGEIEDLLDRIDSIVSFPLSAEAEIVLRIREVAGAAR